MPHFYREEHSSFVDYNQDVMGQPSSLRGPFWGMLLSSMYK